MGQGQTKHDVSVVIVGGGFAGMTLANKLAKSCNVTVVDGSPLFHQSMASLRTAAVPGWTDMVLMEREGNWPAVTQVRGRVTGFNKEEKKVTVEGVEEPVSYDYLVLATGSQVAFPAKVPLSLLAKGKEEVVRAYEECREKVAAASRIVIIGGGAVGIELAAEIICHQPDKEITLVHGKELLCDDAIPTPLRQNIRTKMEGYGVKFLLGEKVDLAQIRGEDPDSTHIAGPLTVTTDKGTSLEADLVFPCVGISVNKSGYEGSLAEDQIERGHVKVDEFLRVQGEENIFAIGDCNNAPVPKLMMTATQQAELLASNMKSKMNDKAMKPYKPSVKPTLVLPIGRADGIGVFNGNNLPLFLIKKVKSHDLITSRVCNDFHMPNPPYPKLPPLPKPVRRAAAAAATTAGGEASAEEVPAAEGGSEQPEVAEAGGEPKAEESGDKPAEVEASGGTPAEEAAPAPAEADAEPAPAAEAETPEAATQEEAAAPADDAAADDAAKASDE